MTLLWIRCPSWARLALTLLFLGGAARASGVGPATTHDQHPESSAFAGALRFEEALRRAAAQGPLVRLSMAGQVAEGRALDSAAPFVTQAPLLQGQLGPRWSRGSVTPEVILGVSQPLSVVPVGPAQRSLVKSEIEARRVGIAAARLRSAERAGHVWIEQALAHARLEMRLGQVESARLLLELARARERAGGADPSEVALLSAEVAFLRGTVLEAEGAHFQAASELAWVTGADSLLGFEVEGELETVLTDPLERTARAEAAPEVQIARERVKVSEREVEVARAQNAAGLSFGVQYQREGTGDQILTGVFSLPLPVVQQGRHQMDRALIQSEAARGEAQYTQTESGLALKKMNHEVTHAQAAYELLTREALPFEREALRVFEAQYREGALGLTVLLVARTRLVEIEERTLSALAAWKHAHLSYLAQSGLLLGGAP